MQFSYLKVIMCVVLGSQALAQTAPPKPSGHTDRPIESPTTAADSNSEVSYSMIKESAKLTLASMKSLFQSQYAPSIWKEKQFQWNLETEYQKALQSVDALPASTQFDQVVDANEMREIFKKFIYSTRDYHVSIGFVATGSSKLPFTVKSVGQRAFIVFIDRSQASPNAFPFEVGDELISFGGQIADEAIKELQNEFTANVAETDRARADLNLTHRRASRGLKVPQGPILLEFLRKGETVTQKLQMVWNHTEENVPAFPASQVNLKSLPQVNRYSLRDRSRMMIANEDLSEQVAATENPFTTGTRRSYIPILGTPVWDTFSNDDPKKSNTFHSYLYKNKNNQLIGVIRIPSYTPDDYEKAASDFAEILTKFEEVTDGLVIDQINNPGGSVFYLYALASMLAKDPLQAPKHRMKITPADQAEAASNLKELETVKTDDDAKKVMGKSWNGFPVNLQVAQFVKDYSRFIMKEYKAGRSLTKPYFLDGADKINPSQEARYSKPVLVIVNELCFSGGDFFPTILQDNKRATIMGVRTAGAGGYVRDQKFPNILGIDSYRVTASIAERVDLNPIENLGVKPDVPYQLTVEDLTSGFKGYAKAIRDQIDLMLQ
jgi:hypothetical protein